MKKTAMCIGVFLLMLISTSVMAETIVDVLDEPLEYLDDTWSKGLAGNVSLSFNNSDTGNNDLFFLNTFYISELNQTFYKLKSMNISYDYNFTNNTKSYYFLDINNLAGDILYRVVINYSSIEVPNPPWWHFIVELEEKNLTIANLTENVTRLQDLVDSLQSSMNTLNSTISSLQEDLDELQEKYDNYVDSNEGYSEMYWDEVNVSGNFSIENIILKSDIRKLLNDLKEKNQTIDEGTSMWSVGYTKDSSWVFYFNGAWLLIGIIIGLAIIMLLLKTDIVRRIFGGRTLPIQEKKEWDMKEDDNPKNLSDVEMKFLEVDEKHPQNPGTTQVTNTVNSLPVEKPKKTSYWDTPAGIERKKKLSEWAKNKNAERREKKN